MRGLLQTSDLRELLPPACLVTSVVALGYAVQIANGFYHPTALGWLSAAVVLCAVGVVWSRVGPIRSRRGLTILHILMGASLGWQLATLGTATPGIYLSDRANLSLFRGLVMVQAALIGLGFVPVRVLQRLWFPALLVVQLVIGHWMLRASPSPRIDVVVVHRAAIEALLEGRNPYRITFQNIYGANSGFYNPDLVVGDRVNFGYPYPPASLALVVPGHIWAGDYRYAELAALVVGAALIGYAQPTLTARLSAALLLTSPRGLFVLEQGWTEPIAVLLFAATIFCLLRRPALAPLVSGLLLVTKQYLVLAGVALLRFATSLGARQRRFVVGLMGAALVSTLPFVFWDPAAFVENVVLLQAREPFRIDSLSYLSWAARAGWGSGSLAWSIAAASAALLVGLLRTPNSAAGLAASLALSWLVMFAFGSKAFCNYYFFVIGVLCCAVAAVPHAADAANGAIGKIGKMGEDKGWRSRGSKLI